ncbi:MAG: hypothetical protein ACFCUN_00395 [Hyphomicrobiaceae bacterium]
MFAAAFRILFGLIVALLVAGAIQVLFALTPTELALAGQEAWQTAGVLVLFSAIASGLVATPIVLLLGAFAEVFRIRSFSFFVLVGVFVALAGFAILYLGEGPNDPTLANSYAIAAYLTSGFFAGISYWLVAGRFAGRRRRSLDDAAFVRTESSTPKPETERQPIKVQNAQATSAPPAKQSVASVPVAGSKPA